MSETIINQRQIHWFPGHMAKTLRLMEQEIRHIDCVLQILDARIPLSSLNPEIERITAGKPHLYVLNKADLADPEITQQWLAYFRSAGAGCLPMDSRQKGRANAIKGPIEKELAALTERRRARGMVGARIHVMVVGIPNVGKSTFINSFAGEARAKAANKPGVTRGKQWITVGNYDLMDMPGVLWKKFDTLETAANLAFIGSIRDDILDVVGSAEELGKNTGIDAQNNRCTYVSLLGLERAQEMVDAYTAAALDALTVFSGDTAFLHDFAVGLATRSK